MGPERLVKQKNKSKLGTKTLIMTGPCHRILNIENPSYIYSGLQNISLVTKNNKGTTKCTKI